MLKYINWKTSKNIVFIGIGALILHFGTSYILKINAAWLWAFYAYFMFAALVVGVMMQHYNATKPEQVGLMFLVSVFIKMMIFTAVFSPLLFSGTPMVMQEKLNVLTPFALFLVLEVVEIMKLLKQQD